MLVTYHWLDKVWQLKIGGLFSIPELARRCLILHSPYKLQEKNLYDNNMKPGNKTNFV